MLSSESHKENTILYDFDSVATSKYIDHEDKPMIRNVKKATIGK